jgi:hypothetical protein
MTNSRGTIYKKNLKGTIYRCPKELGSAGITASQKAKGHAPR